VGIEPQAQLLYQYLHLNQFDDAISPVGSNTTNGLRGRLGFRLFRADMENDSKTSSVTPYFTADVLHDFFSPGQTAVGATSFDDELGKTWYDRRRDLGQLREEFGTVRERKILTQYGR
jgi:outer membrane autotransporter protein